jgi:hypothetical protein
VSDKLPSRAQKRRYCFKNKSFNEEAADGHRSFQTPEFLTKLFIRYFHLFVNKKFESAIELRRGKNKK